MKLKSLIDHLVDKHVPMGTHVLLDIGANSGNKIGVYLIFLELIRTTFIKSFSLENSANAIFYNKLKLGLFICLEGGRFHFQENSKNTHKRRIPPYSRKYSYL
jgi:hypothetical protein